MHRSIFSRVVFAFAILVAPVLCALQSGVYTYELSDSGDKVKITACRKNVQGTLKIPSTIAGKRVTKLKKKSFEGCVGLTAVTIPSTVEEVDENAFKDCSHLARIVFANLRGTMEVGDKAFADTVALAVTLPKNTTINERTFYDSDLRTVTFIGAEPPVWLDEALNARRASDGKLKVKVVKIVIPAHANLAAWKLAVPKYLKRGGTIVRSNPRVWIDSSAEGSVVLAKGKTKLSNGALVAKGAKVSVTSTPKSGFAFVGARAVAEGAATNDYVVAKRTHTMPMRDVTFSASYETLDQERADFEKAFAAMDTEDGVLRGESSTQMGVVDVAGTSFLCVTGRVGRALEAEIRGTSLFSTPVKYVFSGLPSGLSVVKDAEGLAHLVGVPGKAVDFAMAPAYMTVVASSGRSATRRLNLSLGGIESTRHPEDPEEWLHVGDEEPYEGGSVFRATSPGRFSVTLTNVVACAVDGRALVERRVHVFDVLARTAEHANAPFAAVPERTNCVAGVKIPAWKVAGWFRDSSSGIKVSGQPSGIVFDVKKKMFSGTPKKAGTFVTTLVKTVKRKKVVQKFCWVVVPADASMAFDLGTSGPKQDVNGSGNRINVPAGSAGTVRVACAGGAKVTVAGLPAGMKLKAVSGGYALTGTPTKAGTYVVTFTCTKAGATTVRRVEYRVWPHPLRGSYRGAVATPKVGCGAATLVVDTAGRGTLTLVEGTLKTVVKSVAAVAASWSGEADPEGGVFHYTFKLPANKKAGLPARTAMLGYASSSAFGYRRIWRVGNDCGIVSRGKGATLDFASLPYLSAAQLADEDWNAGGAKVETNCVFVCTNAVGGVFRMTGAGTPSTRVLKVAGRLPKGKAFSCSMPAVCGDVEDDGVLKRGEPIAYSPFVVVDADGARYRVTLPLDPSCFGGDETRIERWNGSEFVSVEGSYGGECR